MNSPLSKMALRLFASSLSAILIFSFQSASPLHAQGQDTSLTFPETGKVVRGKFLQYFARHGGALVQGLPISNDMQEKSDTDGKLYTVQYFEKAVFELHPENDPPYDVLLSLLGVFQYKEKYPNGGPGEMANTQQGAHLFPETGKHLGCEFLDFWLNTGGLAQFGYPISGEFTEVSPLNEQTYRVQYFERAVLEYYQEAFYVPEKRTYENIRIAQLGTARISAIHPEVVTGLATPTAVPSGCVPTQTGPTTGPEPPDAPLRSSVGKGHILNGVVKSSRDCSPIQGAKLKFRMAGPDGVYREEYEAMIITGPSGSYSFESHYPGPYENIHPHIHVNVSAPGYRTVETEVFPQCTQTEGTFNIVLEPR